MYSVEINIKMDNDAVREEDVNVTFKSLGLNEVLVKACERLGWHHPSRIQREAIPVALQGRDVIGLAETGSGKTGAFALPILHFFLQQNQKAPLFALVLTPTRELAHQIHQQFDQLGKEIQLKTALVIGGEDLVEQTLLLATQPHIVIGTPGRVLAQLEEGIRLDALKFLVLDEADRILNMDFEEEVTKIVGLVSKKRQSFLFSATMTQKVGKLQRASLRAPVQVHVCHKFQTPETLRQFYVLLPNKHKYLYLYHLVRSLQPSSTIIFCNTCIKTILISRLLTHLGLPSIFLHGQLSQERRLRCLQKFRNQEKSVLVATDLASRGLDIPHVDTVVNYEAAEHLKDYFHRVGRTARAGKPGSAYSLVTQYDIKELLGIEAMLGRNIEAYEMDKEQVMLAQEEVCEAKKIAKRELAELEKRKANRKPIRKGKRKDGEDKDDGGDDDDQEEAAGVRRKFKKSREA